MDDNAYDPMLPDIRLELVEDRTPDGPRGFLNVWRTTLRALHPDGTRSEPFPYDIVQRRALDAVVILAHFRAPSGDTWVYLRSAVRPPVAFRDAARSPVPEAGTGGVWELPAGLVEPGEESPEGLQRAARRELLEELGFDVPAESLLELGYSTFPAPAVIGERHFYFEVEVDPSRRGEPTLDGSALERGAAIVAIGLGAALAYCRSGVIADEKTELALRRFQERLT